MFDDCIFFVPTTCAYCAPKEERQWRPNLRGLEGTKGETGLEKTINEGY